jgi:cell division protein ZapE
MDASLPDRFGHATFETYRAKTRSQNEALRQTQQFVAQLQTPPSFTDRIRRWIGQSRSETPQGLYLVGPVGTGKTHLLAAMYQALTPAISCAFLHSSTIFRRTDPPQEFANALADRYRVCCLDEVEIDDPANEIRLVRVLQTLEGRGVTLLATSNVEPDQFLSNKFGPDRFQRFLHEEFRARYRVLFVGGEDYRRRNGRQRPGCGWVGPADAARASLLQAYEEAPSPTEWMTFSDLMTAATETAHDDLVERLTGLQSLFIAGIDVETTDDALRLLRLIDAFYLHPDAPALYFSASEPPDDWFDPDSFAGVARAVAEKFTRTVSRLRALCEVVEVSGATGSVSAPFHADTE